MKYFISPIVEPSGFYEDLSCGSSSHFDSKALGTKVHLLSNTAMKLLFCFGISGIHRQTRDIGL